MYKTLMTNHLVFENTLSIDTMYPLSCVLAADLLTDRADLGELCGLHLSVSIVVHV